MENPVSATDSASLEHARTESKSKKRPAAKLGKFAQAIRGYFHTSKMTLEDWERLEAKKQIAHCERSNSIHQTRAH